MQNRKWFVGGNWKCNNTLGETQNVVSTVIDALQFDPLKVDVIVAPGYLHLVTVGFLKKNKAVQIAAQNCSMHGFGAYTGQIAAKQLNDISIKWVILGHSQRRTHFAETDDVVGNKVKEALKHDLKIILCFGETLAEREANKTKEVVKRQLDAVKPYVNVWTNIVLAYEPVWAIGTGVTASPQQVGEVHQFVRKYINEIDQLSNVRIIYGGSVSKNNCVELSKVNNVDGFLVGGASLKEDFKQIVRSMNCK